MSLDFLTRPIGGKRTADPDGSPKAARGTKRRGPNPEDVRRPGGTLVIGGSPRADLMPPEIRIKRSQFRTRRSLRLALVAVAAVVVLGCGGTFAWSALAGVDLGLAQAQASTLLVQQNKYADVKNATQSIQLIQAGQKVGAATEIDWQSYLAKVAGTLPAGVTIGSVDIAQATPVAPFQQEALPLQGDHVANLTISTRSTFIPPVAQILASMEVLPGFVDVSPSDIAWQDDGSYYVSSITLHIDTAAFDGRFQTTSGAGK